ncbi:tetratricopeptide repeat protein [Colwellia sp. RE-S-Sl-9]
MTENTGIKAAMALRTIGFRPIKIPLKTFAVVLALIALYFSFTEYMDYKHQKDNSLAIILEPKINDIYFIDFRLIKKDLRPHEKYRIAKVVDITGDIVTLMYGGFYYQSKHAVINAIYYGQLGFKKYFETRRYDISHNEIKNMFSNGAIYLANRPIQNLLYGNVVGPMKENYRSSGLIYGKKENNKGVAFLNDRFNETGLESAFNFFQQSAELGYAKGQVNLAQMYINGQFVSKDFNKALHWLKLASLQSSKTAILKYGIVCKQVKECNLADFYQELTKSGVNIKVRKLDFELSP